MNKLQLFELLSQHHPHLGGRESELYVEMAGDRIALDTGLTKRNFVISSVAGQRWYSLDASVVKVDKIFFNDVKIPRLIGEPIIDDDEFTDPEDSSDTALTTPTANAENKRFWIYSNYHLDATSRKVDRIGIVEKVTNALTRDGRTSDFQSCSITGTSNIRVYATTSIYKFNVSATPGTTDDATSSNVGPLRDIPVQFHEVLLNGAVARGYKDPRNFKPDMSEYFDGLFEEGIKRIKKHERVKHSTGFIKPQDF